MSPQERGSPDELLKPRRGAGRRKVHAADDDFWRQVKELERLVPDNWEFEYVKALPRHLQRMAVFWEYARESRRLRSAFESLPGINEPRLQAMLSTADVLGADEAALLVDLYFPALSFHDLIKFNKLDARFRALTQFGTSAIGCLPIEEFVPLASQIVGKPMPQDRTIHGLLIDWDHTDVELSGMFREVLKQLRPKESPEPVRAGRGGRLSGVSPIDALNQLAALRLDREGFTLSSGAKVISRIPYMSNKGWKLGIRLARERIQSMDKVPFFEKRGVTARRK